MNRLQQFNETAALQRVIIGRASGYRRTEEYVEIVNEEQKKGLPEEDKLIAEFEGFKQALLSKGVEVLIPEYVGKFVYDQLTPRDIGVTIGEKFLICNMKKSSRRYEVAGIFSYLNDLKGEEPNILIPPTADILLEGGDIMVDKGRLLLGISQRSNKKGLEFLKQHFKNEFEVIPLYCSALDEGENVLHLDCTFNPVGENHALIYPQGFREIPEFIKKDYKWIEVTAEEQAQLATNVLSIDSKTVISRNHHACKRVNEEMKKAGIEVIELPFDGAPSTGGSFRCCSLPLFRK